MKYFWPTTLKTRIVVILCGFFVLSHIVSLAIYEHNRDKTVILTEATDLASRIIGIVNLASSFPIENRRQILAAAETQFLAMFPESNFGDDIHCQSNEFSERMSNYLAEAFETEPTISFDVCLRELDDASLLSQMNSLRGFDVLVSINFADSEAAVFHALLPEAESLLKDSVVVYLLVSGLLTLLIAWYLIRKTVVPLEDLALAADNIGVDINAAQLNENGPTEIALAATAFNRMQIRLQQLVHGQTEMLAAISHDLRSAITRLQLRIELMQDDSARDGMLRVVEDMRAMIQSVLDFVRGIDSNETTKNINIAALVESLCADMNEEGWAVTFHGEELNHVVAGRPVALRRGLQNLIDNAVKYGGQADVYIRKNQESCSVVIKDNGPGIPPEELEKVSKPFYRLEKSRNSSTGGVGLGLSIAENIFHAHGANLVLSNGDKQGLVVVVSFSQK